MSKKLIIMIGPFPPPIGGVSIHISRLTVKLNEHFKVIKIDTSKNRFVIVFKLLRSLILAANKPKRNVIHNHVFRLKFNFIVALLSKVFNINYIQTFHSFRTDLNKIKKFKLIMFKYVIKNSYKIIVVNETIKNKLLEFDNTLSSKIAVVPAFLPYDKNLTKNDIDQYIKQLQISDFINSHDLILCGNASHIAFYNNEDLYGIDLCVELMNQLKGLSEHKVGLIFMLTQIEDENYYSLLIKRISDYGLEKDFLFINKKVDLVPLFKKIDIFLRPTNTDGDALSIREALFEGIPSVASDVVQRPIGTVTFKSRDASDLYVKVLHIIKNIDSERKKSKEFGKIQSDFIEEYYSIYKI